MGEHFLRNCATLPFLTGSVKMKSFSELNLSENLLKSIQELGFETPSAIQEQALPILLGEPTDFIGLAATGTGKTAAFSIPMLEQIDAGLRKVQALVMCPTRELAMQVSDQINKLAKHSKIKAQAIYGGASYSEQINGLKNGAQVVVGTPGRLVDHIERGTLVLDNVKHVILDEADEMISMGFKDELEAVLSAVNRDESQIWLFSATMSREVRRVADTYLQKPKMVQVNKTEVVPSTIKQLYYIARDSDKADILCKMIDVAESFYGIIFCQTKSLVTDLTSYLTDRGYKVDCLHGDKDQKARERTMQSFRDHKVKILVCTDVASRGLDVKDITHVINYSLPRELDSYVHRIGRTARSGKEGFAMSLVSPSQERLIYRIEEMTKSHMEQGVIPSRKQVGEKKVAQVLPKFQTQKFSERAVDLLDETWKALLEGMTKEEIAGRFLVMLNPALFSNEVSDSSPRMPGPPQRRDEGGGGRDRGGRRGDRDRGPRARYDRGGDRDRGSRRDFSDRGPRREERGERGEFRSEDRREAREERTERREYSPRAERSERPRKDYASRGERSERPSREGREKSFSRSFDRGGEKPPKKDRHRNRVGAEASVKTRGDRPVMKKPKEGSSSSFF